MERGFLYLYGRDRGFRPIMITRPSVFFEIQSLYPDNKKDCLQPIVEAIIFILSYVKSHMFLNGQAENWVVISDMDKCAIHKLPRYVLKTVGSVM